MQPYTLFACTVSVVTARAVLESCLMEYLKLSLCGGAGRQHSPEEKGKLYYSVLRKLFLEKHQAYYYASNKEWNLNCKLFSPGWLA